MKRFISFLTLSGILLFLFGCVKEREKFAYLKVNFKTTDDSEVVDLRKISVKSGEEQVFSATIINKETGETKQVANVKELSEKPLKLVAGAYSIKVVSSDNKNAAWDKPYYSGSADVILKPEQKNTAEITCSIANTLVTVEFAEDTDNYFSDYYVTVDNGTSSPLIFQKSKGTLKGKAYFAVTGELNWTLYMINKDGSVYKTETASYKEVKPKQHYHLKFKLQTEKTPEGAGFFKIRLNDSYTEKVFPLDLDFNHLNKPMITADFELNNEISFSKGSNLSRIITVNAPKGLKSLVLAHSDKSLLSMGLPNYIELVDINDYNKSILSQQGINVETIAFGVQSAMLDLTVFFSKLNIGTYKFVLLATDLKNNTATGKFNVNVLSPVDAEAIGAVPWAKFAILKGIWFTNPRPESMKFQYKKSTDSEWKDYSGLVEYDDVKRLVTAELRGLESETAYAFKIVTDKEENTKVINFTTEKAETLHNLSFDKWYKEGSCWYPNESSSYRVWDSANPGTSSLPFVGTVTTTPETSDLAVTGEGKQAAKLQSTSIAGFFAAGNIFIGKFVSTVGNKGAKLDWGYEFSSRPLALKGYYKYNPEIINKASGIHSDKQGQIDQCQIRILLTDWTGVFHVNSAENVFVNDDADYVIASASLTSNEKMAAYKEFTLPLVYKNKTKKPTFIVIVAAASRYGDYFTGGVGSTLLLDEFSLEYEPDKLTSEELSKTAYK